MLVQVKGEGGRSKMAYLSYGIDISEKQGDIDLETVIKENDIDFVILRGGFTGWGAGTQNVDDKFERNYEICKRMGIDVGYYYLSLSSSDELVEKEYMFILQQLKDKEFTHVIGIDVENCDYDPNDTHKYDDYWIEQSVADRTRYIHNLAKKLEQAGYYVVIYCNQNYIYNKLDWNVIKAHDIWYAKYIETRATAPRLVNLQQYTSSARLTGYPSNLDHNKAWIDYPNMIKEHNLNHLSTGEVIEENITEESTVNYQSLYESAKVEVDELSNEKEQWLIDAQTIAGIVAKYE